MGGAQQGGSGGGEGTQGLGAHLGGAAAEAAVVGQIVGGDLNLSHPRTLSPRIAPPYGPSGR
ncbi:hypothetical protein KCH_44160 [Kitasatospora cheerisanensis KCTC 2395]|uniref:Uncharacterized protein n=1 Tax=Kitasatospora cheerisanensis KCTC 2395 TaxID=1348663 RepID=A0A066YRC8_9ACTN|nr:hypothetical protein KCH_44160 [Kitasatospora cheerisanensis KCTC 2395]